MIPLADENPSGRRPYVVYVLIALNVLVYIVNYFTSRGPFGGLNNWSMIPASVIHNQPAVETFRVLYGNAIREVRVPHQGLDPQWLTIFTSMFMHASILHIGGNMLFLWVFGNNIEDALGHVQFLLFYLACGFLAAAAHIMSNLSSTVPTVGASGAIAGVLGAYLYLYPGNRVRTLVLLGFFWTSIDIPAVIVLGVWFLTQLAGLGNTMHGGGVAYWAHIGGFLVGLIGIYLLGGRRLRRSRRRYNYQRWE